MTLYNWIFSNFDNPYKSGQWGPLHIATMLICIALIVAFPLIAKRTKNPDKARKIIVLTLVALILLFEITRRVINIIKLNTGMTTEPLLSILLPRPWCAISCWLLIASVFVRRSFFYDFASISALLCSVIFFAYPGVGFNNQYILFENLYSIATHALLLTTSITLMTLGFATFRLRDLWKNLTAFAVSVVYGLVQIFLLKIHEDPMYFMPDGDIQADILGIGYGLYLFLYTLLVLLFIVTPYMIAQRSTVRAFLGRFKRSE